MAHFLKAFVRWIFNFSCQPFHFALSFPSPSDIVVFYKVLARRDNYTSPRLTWSVCLAKLRENYPLQTSTCYCETLFKDNKTIKRGSQRANEYCVGFWPQTGNLPSQIISIVSCSVWVLYIFSPWIMYSCFLLQTQTVLCSETSLSLPRVLGQHHSQTEEIIQKF